MHPTPQSTKIMNQMIRELERLHNMTLKPEAVKAIHDAIGAIDARWLHLCNDETGQPTQPQQPFRF